MPKHPLSLVVSTVLQLQAQARPFVQRIVIGMAATTAGLMVPSASLMAQRFDSLRSGSSPSASSPHLLEVQLGSGSQTGLPIHWSADYGLLLKPSGAMLEFNTEEVLAHRVLEQTFAPQSVTSARGVLQAELGGAYETVAVGPYVLCTPQGHSQRWRERFRNLLAGYDRYFETRGWQLRRPDFPLCVIVLASHADFDRYCRQELGRSVPNLMGYYFPKSNRCVLYEVGGGTASFDWSGTERTIVHEAVHQLAYNTGVHERLADTPQWVVEGLATMFEEPAVFDARLASRSLEPRVNKVQLIALKRLLEQPSTFEGQLSNLIQSNELFQRDTPAAYAISWGLTFYLAERMSRPYAEYSRRLASLPKVQAYTPAERQRDFQRAFESDVSLLSVQIQRFYANLN